MSDNVLIGFGFIIGFCTGCVMAFIDEVALYLRDKRRKKKDAKKL